MIEKRVLLNQLKSSPSERKAAIQYLYRYYFKSIKQYILNNGGNSEDAEDIFQEGLVALYEAVLDNRFRNESSVETYLFAICKNRWLKRWNKIKKWDDNQSPTEEASEPNYDQDKLMTLLEHLNNSCKKLLLAFYYYNQSMAEIKALFSLKSEQVAKNKKRNCMKHLIQIVKDKNLTMDQFITHEF
ncbi:MAG: sigma-70 family RNA polymerase sigma factor [Cytophagales bacterium]|nr:sigma-70 family RNA polymerase sigma factor [Cytophagales bacterium]